MIIPKESQSDSRTEKEKVVDGAMGHRQDRGMTREAIRQKLSKFDSIEQMSAYVDKFVDGIREYRLPEETRYRLFREAFNLGYKPPKKFQTHIENHFDMYNSVFQEKLEDFDLGALIIARQNHHSNIRSGPLRDQRENFVDETFKKINSIPLGSSERPERLITLVESTRRTDLRTKILNSALKEFRFISDEDEQDSFRDFFREIYGIGQCISYLEKDEIERRKNVATKKLREHKFSEEDIYRFIEEDKER
ncbi:hypothetical protein CMI45_02050 [Candidatus Pacearchaeota archaeon]|nr:hypothetical protein [Candidatus Pacearchaeota archaeon]|tara:strand:- start:338 stop:1087 length:750 start_codon:yes stop_codon:yes gene_type:complete